MKLLFLDTETGGLDASRDPLIEVAWSDGGTPRRVVLPHDPATVGEIAAEVNQYYERELNKQTNWSSPEQIAQLQEDLQGVTLVGANIGFDERFLTANGFSGWSYRKLDLEPYALPLVGYVPDKRREGELALPGLHDIMAYLVDRRGYDIPEPDHTAIGDVRTTVAVYEALRHEYKVRGL